jgi:selenide,water dikinase
LVLTKALGTGVVATAIKADKASDTATEAAVKSMTTLNREAAAAMKSVEVRAATDVTGYGLLGHLGNLLLQSGVAAEIVAGDIPVLPEVSDLIAAGHIPGGTRRNLEDLKDRVEFGDQDESVRLILADAQTSGGLLISVPEERAGELMDLLQAAAPAAAIIGRVTDGVPGTIRVL